MNEGGAASEEKRLGQIVQAARKRAGLTQQALCQKSGLSYSTLAKIERGAIKAPSVFTIQTIAHAVGVSLDELLAELPATAPPEVSKKVSKRGVRFVYFDMNGCLVRFYNHAFTKLAADAGTTPDVVETIFWQYNDAVCRGDMSMDELNTVLANRLNMLVDWAKYYLEAVEAMPGMAELVAWVAEHYRVGILSNTMPGLIQAMLGNGTLPRVNYDVLVDSSAVHALKPEARIFEIATEMAGVSPQELLLIDDDRPNLAAAGKLGWHTLSFDAYQPDQSVAGIRSTLTF